MPGVIYMTIICNLTFLFNRTVYPRNLNIAVTSLAAQTTFVSQTENDLNLLLNLNGFYVIEPNPNIFQIMYVFLNCV